MPITGVDYNLNVQPTCGICGVQKNCGVDREQCGVEKNYLVCETVLVSNYE